MSHPRLQLQQFRDFGAELEAQYRATGHNNPHRLSFLALYRAIIAQSGNELSYDMAEVLEGVLIFLIESVDHTYWMRSSTNSEAVRIVYEKMQLKRLNLPPDQRLICLNQLTRYVDEKCSEEMLRGIGFYGNDDKLNFVSNWLNKAALLKELNTALNRVYTHDICRNAVINGLPNLACLQQQAAAVFKSYKDNRSSRWFGYSSNRDAQELLNKLLDAICMSKYQTLQEEGNADAIRNDYHTRQGIMLLLIMDLESEAVLLNANGGWFNKGSDLLKELKKILNPEQVDYNDKVRALEAVKKEIDDFRNLPEIETNAIRQIWKSEGVDLLQTLANYSEKVREFDVKVRTEKNRPSMANSSTSFAVGCATKTALSAATPFLTVTGGGIASAVGGPIGFAIYMLTVTGIKQLLNTQFISTLEASLYGWLFESIGKAASKGVSSAVKFVFDSRDRNNLRILEELLPHDERVLFVKYVNTLLQLPMVSEKEKASLRFRRGLQPGEFLPLPTKRLENPAVRLFQQPPAAASQSDYTAKAQEPTVRWLA